MGKEKKGFSKKAITVRAVLLPAGEAPITGNVESMVATLTESMNIGMARFFIGNGNIGIDDKTFIGKTKGQGKSILGDKDSIFNLLEGIKQQMISDTLKSEFQFLLNKQANLLSSGLYINGSIPYLKLLYDYFAKSSTGQTNASSDETTENLMQLIKDHDEVLDKIGNILSTDLATVISNYKENIDYYQKSTDELLGINRDIIDNKIEALKEAKIRILLESTGVTTIEELINFANENTDQFIKNIDNVDKFFTSLKQLENLNITNTLSSFSDIGTLFQSIGDLMKMTEASIELFTPNNIDTIIKIFGDNKTPGILKTIVTSLDELPDLSKAKQKSVIDSLVGTTKVFGAAFIMFTVLWPFVLTFHKPMAFIEVGIERIFTKLGQVFKLVNNFKDNNIDDATVKTIVTNINNLRKVLKNTHLLAIESWVISKAIGKGEYVDRVRNLMEKIAWLMLNVQNEFDAVEFEHSAKTIESFVTIMDAIDSLSKKKKFKNVEKNIDAYFNVLEKFYKKLEEKYDQIIKTSEKVEALKEANKKIQEGVDDCTETAVKTSKETNDVNKGLMTLEGLTEFMISAAVVMSVGALFMMLGGGKFAAAALEFGVTLMTFEMLVVTPILLFRSHEKMAAKSLGDLNSFIITCTITMSIGALFIALGGGSFVKNALAFGIVLSIFELLVVAPFLAFVKHKTNVMKGLSEFSGFLITCTIIMSVGALFMALGGGKFVKNALKFGLALAAFEILVISPFILFGLIKNSVFENAKDFIAIVITCTTIMLVGALFVTLGGGKFVKNAVKFTAILMLFEMMVIAPFLLMNLLKSQTFNGIKLFTTIIISSTIILLVGSLFMTLNGGKNWKNALKFTGLLMLFEIGVITPFLLFNKISNQITKGLITFAAVILASTTILMVGAMFMTIRNGEMPWAAVKFTAILSGFILAMGYVAKTLDKWLGDKELVKMEEFGTFVLLSTVALTIGAFVIDKYGWSAPAYAVLLTGFVAAMAFVAGKLTKFLDDKTLIKMEEFGIFVLLSSVSLVIGALFISQFGANPVIEFGICLLGFVGLTTLVVALISKFINPKAIVDISMFGTFLLLASGSMVLGSLFIEKYGVEPVFKFMGMLLLYITEATLIMLALQFAAPYIALGIVTAAALGIALFALTTSIMLVNTLFLLDPSGKKTQKNIATLTGILSLDLMLTFSALGVLMPFITIGGVAAVAIGVSMLVLGGSLTLINLLIGSHGDEIIESIIIVDTILEHIKWTYFKLSFLSPFIILGSAAAVAIGVSMTLLSTSLFIMHKMLKDLGYERLLEELAIIGTAVVALGVLASSMILLVIPLTLVTPALLMLNVFSDGLTNSILMIHRAIEQISKEGDLTNDIKTAVSNLKQFIDIPNQIFDGGWVKSLLQLNNIYKIRNMAIPMSQVMLTSAKAIQGMASLKVPTEWDKDGNPIKYRQLSDKDFQLAIKNTGDLLKSMASAFYYTWNGGTTVLNDGTQINLGQGLKELYKTNGYAVNNIVNFGINAGKVINGLAEGVGNMAKMQIPIAWDKNGKPIGYRQLKQKDFALAAEGTKLILTSMAESIVKVYDSGNDPRWKKYSTKNIFDFSDFEDSPFSHTLEASLKMAELVGNVGSAVGNIAKMQIPNEWDKKGNVTGYKTLRKQDFIDMGNSVSEILGAIITCIAEIYNEGSNGGKLNKGVFDGNIFDMVSGGLFQSDKPSKFEQVLGSTFKISELIAKIGSGVKDLAKLQIPQYDNKGNITGYTKLGPEDFTKLGQSVGNIVTAVVNAVSGLDLSCVEKASGIFDAIMPVNEFVSGIADGIIKIASGQIPVYDKDGKTIKEYRTIDSDTYKQAGTSVGQIINGIATEIIKIANDDKQPINSIFLDGTFKELVESISSMTGLISGITDSIIKLGTAQIPIHWDKNGKPDQFDHINIGEAKENLKNVVSEIISAMSNAIITVYNEKKNEGLFVENPGSGNTPFDIAVRGITGVTKIVSGITDSVIKISQAQIPDKWDEHGNPIHYKEIQVGTAITNIKKMFNGDGQTEGILDILMSVFQRTYNKWFANNKQLDSKIETWQNGINGIIKIVSNSAEMVVNLASLSVPMAFDKDGKGINFKKLNENHIADVKTNVETILNALLSLPTIDSGSQTDITQWADATTANIEKIGGVIALAANMAEEFARYQDISNKLFNKKNPGKLNTSMTEELRTNIELIKGIYDIETNANEFTKSSIERIADDLYHFVAFGINCFDESALKRFGELNKSIKTIYDNIGSQKDNSQNFKNNTIQLQNYIKAINTVDVRKVDSLTKLVSELNKLSNGMQGLDNLTTAIAEKLSAVLADLVAKLEESKTTIETAERIQTNRHKLIEKSIKDVREIMENPISVLVSSDTTQTGDDGQPPTEEDKKKTPGYKGGKGEIKEGEGEVRVKGKVNKKPVIPEGDPKKHQPTGS